VNQRKIAVVGSPRLLREVAVGLIAEAPEIGLIAEFGDSAKFVATVEATAPDYMLALSEAGRSAFVYELRAPVRRLSPETLLEVLLRARRCG
jgi:hypothetical protein